MPKIQSTNNNQQTTVTSLGDPGRLINLTELQVTVPSAEAHRAQDVLCLPPGVSVAGGMIEQQRGDDGAERATLHHLMTRRRRRRRMMMRMTVREHVNVRQYRIWNERRVSRVDVSRKRVSRELM